MTTSKTINNVTKLQEALKINIREEDKKYFEDFFKNRFVRVDNKKITYPEKKDLLNKNKELYKRLTDERKTLGFWIKEKREADNYYKINSLKKHFKKIYWAHKIKMMTDPEYKEDVAQTRLSEATLTDPNYEQLLETFLTDSDYRKKLKDTVNTSVVYKNFNVGDANKKKIDFKKDTAVKKIAVVNNNIKEIKHKIKINNTIIKYK